MSGKSQLKRYARLTAAIGVLACCSLMVSPAYSEPYWVSAMSAVNASFTGEEFYVGKAGDSYPVSSKFWDVFVTGYVDLDGKIDERVVDSMLSASYQPDYDSLATKVGASTFWLLSGDPSPLEQYLSLGGPEVSVVIIGSSDISMGTTSNIPTFFYTNLTEIVDQLLASNSIPILTTLPPQEDRVHLVLQANEVISMVASNKNVPLNDYYTEVITRQPTNWHGTLISGDGIHPSSTGPGGGVGDFTDDNLNTNGYALLNYTTLKIYGEVLDHVLGVSQGVPVITSFAAEHRVEVSGGGEGQPPEGTTNDYVRVDLVISNFTPYVGYRLYRSLDLTDGGGWEDLGNISSGGGVVNRTDSASNEWGQVFYKVE